MSRDGRSNIQKRGIKKGSVFYEEFQQWSKKVRSNIGRLRLQKGLTQEQMEEYELNLRQFQRIEGGDTVNMTLSYLFRIAKALGVKPSQLLD